MTTAEIGFIAGIGIPILAFLITISIQWGSLKTTIGNINTDLIKLVADKDKTHTEMIAQMRADRNTLQEQIRLDRDATDRRLRWLEENAWKKSANG